MEKVEIRSAGAEDAGAVRELIVELAEYEGRAGSVLMTAEILADWIGSGQIGVLLAECGGQTAGFILFYRTYATFSARTGLFIEDLFVRPAFRRQGIGSRLFHAAARLAPRGNIDWQVLDWNTESIRFYEKLGGKPLKEWLYYRWLVDSD